MFGFCRDKASKYVMARISGGLGNQLFTFATMMRIAAVTGRDILIDSSEYMLVRDRKFELLNFIGPSKARKAGWLNSALSCLFCILEHFGFVRTSALIMRLWGWERFCFDVTRPIEVDQKEFDAAISSKSRVLYLTGCCQRVSLIADKESVWAAFVPAFKLGVLVGCEESSVSIHVRRGDYLKVGDGTWALDEEYYRRAIAMIEEKVDNPVWYVFSDDIDWCREMFPDLKNAIFIDGDVNHPCYDLLRMAQCKHHIIANSTFSWWGAFLSRYEGRIICPNIWVAGLDTKRLGIVPDWWLLVTNTVDGVQNVHE